MEIKGEYQIASSREDVWLALNDPEMLKKCIPGCESLEMISDTELAATVMAAIGPVRARFNTKITLENLNPPESYTLVGESKAGVAGFGRGAAYVTLTENDDGTLLTYSADLLLPRPKRPQMIFLARFPGCWIPLQSVSTWTRKAAGRSP